MVNSYSLSDDSGVMAAAAITHFLFGQAVFSYLNGWSVLIGPGTSTFARTTEPCRVARFSRLRSATPCLRCQKARMT